MKLAPQPVDRDPKVFAHRPPFSVLKSNYPVATDSYENVMLTAFGVAEDPATKQEKAWAKAIGELIKKEKWKGVTCSIRISSAINTSAIQGHGWLIGRVDRKGKGPVMVGWERRSPSALVITGTPQMARYLGAAWGEDHYHHYEVSEQNTVSQVLADMAGKKGVVVFRIDGADGSVGHATLWDGQKLLYDAYEGGGIPNMASSAGGLSKGAKYRVLKADFWAVPPI